MKTRKSIKDILPGNTCFRVLLGTWITFSGCKSDTVFIDPQNPVLGKWVLIQMNDTRVESDEYQEFLPDNVLRFYRFNESAPFSESIYRINDSLLLKGRISENGRFAGEAYKYLFFDKSTKLKLIPDYDNTTIFSIAPIPVTIYKRIK